MTFKVGGTEVGLWSTAETHSDFYGLNSGESDGNPQAEGLEASGVFSTNGGVHACRIGLHENTNDGTYAFFIHNGEDDGSGQGQAKTVCERLTVKIESAGYVFDSGQGILTGSHGQTNYVHISGDPLTNTGTSSLVFESGVGIDYANVSTVVEDDPEDPNVTSDFADSYDTTGSDAIAQHGYGRSASDGVMWPIEPGSYSFPIRMETVDDGRTLSTTDYPLPGRFYGVGPSSFTDAGPAGEGASVTVDVNL